MLYDFIYIDYWLTAVDITVHDVNINAKALSIIFYILNVNVTIDTNVCKSASVFDCTL